MFLYFSESIVTFDWVYPKFKEFLSAESPLDLRDLAEFKET